MVDKTMKLFAGGYYGNPGLNTAERIGPKTNPVA